METAKLYLFLDWPIIYVHWAKLSTFTFKNVANVIAKRRKGGNQNKTSAQRSIMQIVMVRII